MYKKILTTCLSALITLLVVYGGYTIYAEGNYSFTDTGLRYSTMYNNYHSEMNDYFNAKIKRLNEILEEPDFFKNEELVKDFNIPEDIKVLAKEDGASEEVDNLDTIAEKCEGNVSTYCVSMGALKRYVEYVKALNVLVGKLATDTNSTYIGDLITETQARNEKIAAEYDQAKQVMEATIATYNEYRLAYPMHKKYVKIIEILTKYKLALKDLKRQATLFPVKFVDATSDECQ